MGRLDWNRNLTLLTGKATWLSHTLPKDKILDTSYGSIEDEPEAIWFYPANNDSFGREITSGTPLYIGSFAGKPLHHWLDFPDPTDGNLLPWRKWMKYDASHQWVIWAVDERPVIDSTTPFHLQAGRGHGYIKGSLGRIGIGSKDVATPFIASIAPGLRGEAAPLQQLFAEFEEGS